MDEATNTKPKGSPPFRWFSLAIRRSKPIISMNEVSGDSSDERDFNAVRTSSQHQFGVVPDGNRPMTASAADRAFKSSTRSVLIRPVPLARPPTAPQIYQPLLANHSTTPFPHLPTISQAQGEA